MKQFKDKVRESREVLELSQAELAAKIGVSQRSIVAYETGRAHPRGTNARKLARVLQVSLDYLLNDEIEDPRHGIEKDPYLEEIYRFYGKKAEQEADLLLRENIALFAGGTLSQAAKDAFFEAVMRAYVTCKEESRRTFGPKTGGGGVKKGKTHG